MLDNPKLYSDSYLFDRIPSFVRGESVHLVCLMKAVRCAEILPVAFIGCIVEIAPKLKRSAAWYAFGGELSEKLAGVSVIPKEIEILTDIEGVQKIEPLGDITIRARSPWWRTSLAGKPR
jgi:hypothetical protein